MHAQYDAVVIGSGFGGAVTACRLAQGGMKVCILERGRWWSPETYPLHNSDPGSWLWNDKCKGLYQYFHFKNMDAVVAAGVGGGSLIYANVLIMPPAEVFASGWPASITLSALAPYYQMARDVLHPTPYPRVSSLAKSRVLKLGAELTGRKEQYELLDLAVYWGQPGVPAPDPYGFGTKQTGCLDLAECVAGCPIKAKNTLDLNYLTLALKNGAECRSLHEVSNIGRTRRDFTVYYLNCGGLIPEKGHIHASRVVLAAGTLGSTSILLKSVGKYRTLGPLSHALGKGFSGNGDFLAGLFNLAHDVDMTVGPTITSGISYPVERFIIEEGGLPPLLKLIQHKVEESQLQNSLPLLLIGRDNADGQLKLTRKLKKLTLKWSPQNSMPLFSAMEQRVRELAQALGGRALFSPAWSRSRKLITVHPLGGCRMADSEKQGVVNGYGAVYGQPGLYIADGSIVPAALGANPSFTIAALAERIAEHIIQGG